MFDSRTAQESRTYGAIVDQLSVLAPVFKPVPRSIVFPDASEQRLPLALYQPKHPAVKILDLMAKQLEQI